MIKKIIIISFLFALTTHLISAESYKSHHEKMHGKGSSGHGHMDHDEVNMPGLQGKDTTELEVNDLKNILSIIKKLRETLQISQMALRRLPYLRTQK